MARFLAYTAPGTGHLYPLLPTLLELALRGHDVTVMTEHDHVATAERLGLRARPIDPAIEAIADDTWRAKTPVGSMRRSVRMYVDRAEHEVRDVRKAIRVDRPDVMLLDNNCWGAAAAAQAAGIPFAQAATFLLPLVSRDAPPFGLGLRPARTALGRARDTVLRLTAVPMFDQILGPVNRMRKGLGVPPVKHLPDLYTLAPLVLSYTAEPMEYPRSALSPAVRMVGPGSWDDGADDEPEWLAKLDKPLVLVTVSTVFQDDARLVRAAVAGLAGEPYDVVVTTATLDPATFDAPPNVHLFRHVPHSIVLRRAVAVVCHGGMGITQKALLAGVPVCVVPFGRDQFEVARRVTEAGAGVRLPSSRLTPARVREAVRAAAALRPGAQNVAARLAEPGGAPTAATALEGLVAETPFHAHAGGQP